MSFLKGTILLLLLVVIGTNAAPGPAAEECANVTKRLPTKDLHEIFGDWVLVWSVSNHDLGHGLLENLLSSHVEFKLDNDNKTIDYIERNQFVDNGNLAHCTTYYTKMTMPSDDAEHHTIKSDSIRLEKDGEAQEYTEIGDVDFYQTCDDCLLMDYKTSTHQFLLFYKKEGSHQDAEQHKTHHDDHKKLAECMGFPHNKPFVYNGKADFCHKLSAPLSEECRPLVTALSLADMSVIYGNWIMVWSVSEREIGKALLGMMATSHVEFKALHDNKAVEFILRNMFTGGHKSCITYYANMTKVPDDPEENSAKCVFFRQETNGVLQAYNETGVVDFYQTCPDCLLITYNILAERFLLSYRREGSHQDVKQHKTHHAEYKKVSECLGFPDRPPYIYNGKADFCHKKSAPEPSAE